MITTTFELCLLNLYDKTEVDYIIYNINILFWTIGLAAPYKRVCCDIITTFKKLH